MSQKEETTRGKTYDAFAISDMIASESVYKVLYDKEEEKRERELIDQRTESFVLGIMNKDQRIGLNHHA
jgi:hypothetical protein